MRELRIVAYMVSTTTRRDVRAETLRALAATDWGAPPVVVLSRSEVGRVSWRIANAIRDALERAVQDPRADLVLLLEDDIEPNLHLRHNLTNWPPIARLGSGAHLCASLYDCDIGSIDPAKDAPTVRVADPALAYGSQAVVLARPTAQHVLDQWRTPEQAGDLKIFRSSAMVTDVLYHRPSLVQHRAVPSTWGGATHRAEDFSATWRATPVPAR